MSFDVEQYQRFIAGKRSRASAVGFDPPADLNRHLFPWQADIVRWCLRLGRGAMFERPGLGKTLQQLAWGECVVRHTNKPVVILCPLAVGQQTVEEATKFGIGVPVKPHCRAARGTLRRKRLIRLLDGFFARVNSSKITTS